jgi:glycosyltransferase involved in cell wall biosynthesis
MRERKRLCFLLPTHFSSAMGGAEYQVMFVLDSLCKKRSYDIHYLCRNTAADFVPNGYKIHKIGSSNGLRRLGLFFDTFSLYSALKEIGPDIIYQNIGCAYTGIAANYAKKFKVKLIFHIASDNNVVPLPRYNFKRRFTSSLERPFINYGIRRADIIVGQTKHQSELLEKKFRRRCDFIIPIGHPFPANIIKKPDRVTVLWLANLKPMKQPEVFIRLAKEVGKTNDVSFVMMGRLGGPEKWLKSLMEQIKNVSKLQYLGEVSQNEANQRLSEGHILVNTSRFEGFSNTFVQAWLRQVPVVSLTVDPDNILAKEKLGFCSGTFERLCSDVRILTENKAIREEMGIRARCYARKNHGVEKMIEKVSGLFE